MTVETIGLVSVIGILAVACAVLWQAYNRLVVLKNQCDNAFAQIEVQLKRRYDLIPNLVESVKGYLRHERETLEAVIAARNQAAQGLSAAMQSAQQGMDLKPLMQGEGALVGALGRMNMVMEAYPEIKANETVAQLTEELTHTENRVAFARQAFNDLVTAFNTYRQGFPVILVAGTLGYGVDRELLEFADSEAIQEAPSVALV